MPRKTSFCNGTLLRSDLRHYWPAGFLYVLVWLVLLPIPLLQTGFDYARSWADRPELLAAELHNIYYSAMTGSMVLAVLAGIVMPMAVYAYLMAPRAVGLMHALPVKRTTQYFSHFAAGFGLLTGGNVLIFLLSVLAQLPYGGADWAAAGLWLLVTELLELFFLSLGTLCAMATGWLLAIPVLYGAVNFTALLLCTVVQYLQRLFYFGFDSTTYPVFVEWLTPTITLSEAVCSYWGDWVTRDSREVYLRALPERALMVLAVYTAAALALLALGCHLCRTCQTGRCSWGIATQDPELVKRLDIESGSRRLVNLLTAWKHEIKEMMGGMGINSIEALRGNRLMLRGIGMTDRELAILGISHAGE